MGDLQWFDSKRTNRRSKKAKSITATPESDLVELESNMAEQATSDMVDEDDLMFPAGLADFGSDVPKGGGNTVEDEDEKSEEVTKLKVATHTHSHTHTHTCTYTHTHTHTHMHTLTHTHTHTHSLTHTHTSQIPNPARSWHS